VFGSGHTATSAGVGAVLSSPGSSHHHHQQQQHQHHHHHHHPVGYAMRLKACVTVPAIMLRETIAHGRVHVAYITTTGSWCVGQVCSLAGWLGSSIINVISINLGGLQKMGMNSSGVVMMSSHSSSYSSSHTNSHSITINSSNSKSNGSNHAGVLGSASHGNSIGGRLGHGSGREQQMPLLSKDSVSNM
jgi:hypothetical protein